MPNLGLPTTTSAMRGFALWALIGLGACLSQVLAASTEPSWDATARQNLLFSWKVIPHFSGVCLSRPDCVLEDGKSLELLLEAYRQPEEKQPKFVFHSRPEGEFCLKNREVYVSTRTWSSTVRVCEPKLFDAQGRLLWPMGVSLIEMAELALVKATFTSEETLAHLATRLSEVAGLEIREERVSLESYSGFRFLFLQDGSTLREYILYSPTREFDFRKTLTSLNPCARVDGEGVFLDITSAQVSTEAQGTSDIPILSGRGRWMAGCKFKEELRSIRGDWTWVLSDPLADLDLRIENFSLIDP